ncbi:unnamed protein product [Ilex paraguariensis]|uniref:YTH domain-containing protein n=1 Tax=Ilex paraguariensis TaxID=185542 RepID=A0ABC8RE10_9AQUA
MSAPTLQAYPNAVPQISRDCQELEPSIGEQLASLLYLEPDRKSLKRLYLSLKGASSTQFVKRERERICEESTEASTIIKKEDEAISIAAESKREEEKAKGVNLEKGNEDPDIVPFEDNEEEEEEESEEDDENYGQGFGAAAQGRGRGGGMMWPPQMALARGARPLPGLRSFAPGMMGPDGFSYGAITPDGFPMPDVFGMAPRAFAPYGPRFSGDFAGPASGMMFHSRPSQPRNFQASGFGMMMGPGRAPFMGGMGIGASGTARGGRPVGMSPMFPPPASQPFQNSYRAVKRDQRAPANDRNDRYSAGSDQGKGQEMAGGGADDEAHYQRRVKTQPEDLGTGNSFKNDESESEDEAPRRSRDGEGKKKRRSLEGHAATGSDQQV